MHVQRSSTFVRVDGEMHWLSAYFDNPELEVQATITRIILIISGTETVPLQNNYSCQCVFRQPEHCLMAYLTVECPCIFVTPLIKPGHHKKYKSLH